VHHYADETLPAASHSLDKKSGRAAKARERERERERGGGKRVRARKRRPKNKPRA